MERKLFLRWKIICQSLSERKDENASSRLRVYCFFIFNLFVAHGNLFFKKFIDFIERKGEEKREN